MSLFSQWNWKLSTKIVLPLIIALAALVLLVLFCQLTLSRQRFWLDLVLSLSGITIIFLIFFVLRLWLLVKQANQKLIKKIKLIQLSTKVNTLIDDSANKQQVLCHFIDLIAYSYPDCLGGHVYYFGKKMNSKAFQDECWGGGSELTQKQLKSLLKKASVKGDDAFIVEAKERKKINWLSINRDKHSTRLQAVTESGVRCLVAVPVIIYDEVIAVIELFFLIDSNLNLLRSVRKMVSHLNYALEKQQSEEEIHYLAQYDPITKLPNRNFFQEYLKKAIQETDQRGDLLAVFFVDIDRFKNINDQFGHDCGDEVLKMVAESIQRIIKDSDRLVRFSGDEFLIVSPGLQEKKEVKKLAERIINSFDQPLAIDSHRIKITVSIGIATYPFAGGNGKSLLQHADLAVYESKKSGRNNYQFFTESLFSMHEHNSNIEQELRYAIEKNELTLNYQPIISVENKQVIGLEVLLRWHNKKLGNVPPDEFIQVAEVSGLIEELDNWVLKTACSQFTQWQKEIKGLNLYLSLNCSTVQLQEGKLLPYLKNLLKEVGLSSDKVIFEVTETALMEQVDKAVEILNDLNQLGIQIAIDDFGTGYSSFNYLKKLPVSLIKIDKSFVEDLEDDRDDQEIVQAIIQLARILKLETIAEGVETKQEFDYLKKAGCTYAQGYYFAKPMNKEDMEAYLKTKGIKG